MKIGIDTFGCDEKSSAGFYLKYLLKNLNKVKSDIPIEFELFGVESKKYDYEAAFSDAKSSSDENPNIKFSYVSVMLPESPFGVKLWHSVGCDIFFKMQKYDAVIFLNMDFFPMRCSVTSIGIVNDVISLILSKLPFHSRLKLKIALKKLNKIIVPTQFVKKDFRSIHINQNRIAVVHNGLDHSVFYPRESLEFDSNVVDIKPFAIQKPYFIYVSRMSTPLKRHCELIKAFSDFKERTNLPHRLVLAGEEGDYLLNIQQTVAESPYASDIFITGYYPHDSYPELYAGSNGCIYPSVCEGVGMPVIEAMAMGIPVACAKNGAIPEIAGEYAIYFDGNSIYEMSAAIEKLALGDENSCSSRKRMVSNALAWASRFTWQKTSEDLVEEVKKIISTKNK